MSAYIKFTPLSGAHNEDPLCYLLEIDEAKLLLDCGWRDAFDPEELNELKRVAKHVDAVLFSHADIEHLGAYPYALGKLGLNCPSYATVPIHDMGQVCMYDAYQSKCDVQEFNTFNLDHVDAAFEKMVQLRYSQPYSLSGKCKGITITAYGAGHTVGGTVWRIRKDTDEVVYAVDYNHKKDRHLNGTVLMTSDTISRPSVLITDSYNALNDQPLRKVRDAALLDTVTAALAANANVLIPVDSSTRVLELAFILEQYWSMERLQHPLIFLSHQSYRTMSLARTMLEWMGDEVAQAFSQRREVPFDFKFLRTLYRLKDVEKINGAKLVLAPLKSLDTGWSHQLLQKWCEDEKNIIILPDRGHPDTVTRTLYETWNLSAPAQDGGIRSSVNVELDMPITIRTRIPLEGNELTEFLAREQQRREAESLQQKSTGLLSDDESDEDDEGQISEVANILAAGFDIYVKDQVKTAGFFKQSQSYRMFPVHEVRKRVDDYGEVIDPEVYMRGEYQYALAQKEEEMEIDGEEVMKRELESLRHEEDKVPSKYTEYPGELKIRCKVMYIDFEGRTDGMSIKNILAQVQPRKLIFIHGSEDSTNHLLDHCLNTEALTSEVFAPQIGETVNVSAATNIYQLKLTDSLVSSLRMAAINDYTLSYIHGLIHVPPASVTTSTAAIIPTLDLLPPQQQPLHPSLLVGDLKLSSFRKQLQNEGFTTRFVGGILIVNESIIVRREGEEGASQLIVEGPVGRDYTRVRELLYGGFGVL
ncbi:beta-lactamase-like protein [Gaertneriomyces semiglobifer]|nr:beta-lactamase-like protein [Gaertneriomyces semiglobifer]